MTFFENESATFKETFDDVVSTDVTWSLKAAGSISPDGLNKAPEKIDSVIRVWVIAIAMTRLRLAEKTSP